MQQPTPSIHAAGGAVEHIILIKAIRPFSEAEIAVCQTLKQIPGVLSVSCGPNYTARGQGYNYGIVVRFVSKMAEAAYQSHPVHVRIRDEVLKPLLAPEPAPVLAIDYVFELKECPIDWKGFMLAGAAFGAVAALALRR